MDRHVAVTGIDSFFDRGEVRFARARYIRHGSEPYSAVYQVVDIICR
jgi:hypothetical protein